MLRTNSLSNETNNIKAQQTDTNRVNDDNSNLITENLARFADGLANISIKIERAESELAYHSNMVAGDMANILFKIGRVKGELGYRSISVAGDFAKVSSRIEKIEVSLKEIAVSYL